MRTPEAILAGRVRAILWFATAAVGCGSFSGDPARCSDIVLAGETIPQVQGTGPLPTPMGGTVVDGTYVLTKDEAFAPQTADPLAERRETIEIAGSAMRIVYVSNVSPLGVNGLANLTTSGTQLTITWTCAGTGSYTSGYTATATDLVLISPPGSVSTFTKQ
jgi:hypothetical protein